MVGELFGVDPITVLAADAEEWLIRIAAYNIVVRLRNEQMRRGGGDGSR